MSRRHLINSSDVFFIKGFTVIVQSREFQKAEAYQNICVHCSVLLMFSLTPRVAVYQCNEFIMTDEGLQEAAEYFSEKLGKIICKL